MEYVKQLLESKLIQEQKVLSETNKMIESWGDLMPHTDKLAFETSKKLAEERIPQLIKAIELITNNSK